MRYMDIKGHTHKVFDVGGYRHNYEGFYEKTAYQMSINRGKRPQLEWSCKPCENALLSSLFLLVKSFEEEL